jgi:glycosyltransferase involved in cell wall biosynthesis
MRRFSRIVSVCRWLPSPDHPTAGLFVSRRLEAMARFAGVEALQPIPYFPVLRKIPSWANRSRRLGDIPIAHSKMFYTPKILKSLDGLWLARAITSTLRAMDAEQEIEVIDAHFGYPDGVGCFLAAKRCGIPLFVTFRGLEANYANDPLVAPQISSALSYATGCICVSHVLRELALQYGAPAQKIRVIPNAVDRAIFQPGDRSNARATLGVDAKEPLIVAVGNLVAVKGHDTLIEAFAATRAVLPTARLAIVGGAAHEPSYPAQLEARVATLGLRTAVSFVGTVTPNVVADWLRAANVFALASRREGCCNAILEALATGTPVVATDVGDNARYVRNGENGFIVPGGEPHAFAERLLQALQHRSWDKDSISRELAVGDWSRVATQVLDFFDERLQDRVRKAAASCS